MWNGYGSFAAFGAILMRLPFNISLKSIYRNDFTKEEEAALTHALKIAIAYLMTSKQDYGLEEEDIGDCAAGAATELVNIFIAERIDRTPPKKRMQVDGHEWELMFDPGPLKESLRTDEKGRVWQKLQAGFFDDSDDDLPF